MKTSPRTLAISSAAAYAARSLTLVALAAAFCATARANITIVPTFDASITSDPNASTIEAGINLAIAELESHILNPITVNIRFEGMGSGLGQSSTYTSSLLYSRYLFDLNHSQTLSSNDSTAIASLASGSTNPVNGNSKVNLTLANLAALGESVATVDYESTIGLNFSIMNLARTGTQNAGKYDLVAVTLHELDEALGIGGSGSVLYSGGAAVPTGPVGALDLFRYSSSGVRSFTTDTSAAAYFSIDGGVTDLIGFNHDGGGDYADWANNPLPQVQNAYGSPGKIIDLGANELTALDVVGYNLTVVPEPGSVALFAVGALAVAAYRRRV